MRRLGARLLLAVLACGLTGPAPASEQAGRLLRDADALRSSNPRKLLETIKALQIRSDLAEGQRDHLRYLQAYAASYQGNHDESLAISKSLADSATDADIRVRSGALAINTLTVQRQFAAGLRQLERTLALSEKVHDPSVRDHALYVAAMLHNAIGQYTIGKQYADAVLGRPGLEPRTRCFASELKYEAMLNLRTLDPASSDLDGAVEFCRKINEPVVAGLIRGLVARELSEAGRQSEAIKLLQDAMPEVEATGYFNLVGQMHALLAVLLEAEGRDALAMKHANIAISHAEKVDRSQSLIEAYRTLYSVSERRGDLVSALRYFKLYAKADVEFVNEANAREMAYQVVRQESEAKSQEISLLNRQNEVLTLQQKVDKQSAQNMTVLAALALLLVGAIGYWAWRIKRMEHALRQQTEVDGLTGVSSRQYFSSEAKRQLAASQAKLGNAAMIMLDLDHFKEFNDSHGHDTGDWVLHRAAQACKAACRKDDLIGRMGGEEFAMLLLGVDRDGAVRIAQDCRAAVQSIGGERSELKLKPSASFGIALSPLSGYDFARLIASADKALYQAKRDGRNCVRVYEVDAVKPASPGVPDPDAGVHLGLQLARAGKDVAEGFGKPH